VDGYKDLVMPPVFGGSGAPPHTPPGQEDLTLPETIGGSVPGMGMPQQKDLTLPPTVG
jgi:hypothetical protein